MGIKKLNSFIKNKKIINVHKSIKNFLNNNNNNNKYTLAIDVLLYAHKYKYSNNNIIFGFFNLIIKLLMNNILPIPVFDGKAPIEKKNIIEKRLLKKDKIKDKIKELEKLLDNNKDNKEIKNKINKLNKRLIYISKNDLNNLKKLFVLMNIPYLEAKGEADYMCAKLYKENKIDACLSDDMDILAHGCNKLIKINGKKVIEYDLDNILKKLEINNFQFIDMCILFGCDYIKSLPNITTELSYNLIKEYKCLDNIKDNFMDYNNYNHIKFINNYKNVRSIFINESDKEIIPDTFKQSIDKPININNLLNFLKDFYDITSNNFIKYEINLETINNLIFIKKFI